MGELANAPQEFVDFIAPFTWRGRIVVRKCKGFQCSDSNGPNARTTVVKIEAIEGANDLVLGNIPANGYVIGRLINLGSRREKYFDIDANSGEWYVVATMEGTVRAPTIKLWNLTFESNGKPKLEPGKKFPFSICHTQTHPTEPDAGFKDCSAAPGPDMIAANSFDRGAWFTCSVGCCTSDSGRGDEPRDTTRTDSTKKPDSTAQPRP